ncbi:5875_t:CDS:2 [Funneliformis mosseae]|uniref:5875_t:CDS:1 n=1 Tax=Funneliformis mosseae TaxID=27381 RepID=A0A9N9H5P5_FUNMO|nr:5875_t:CDS:2 [Funneliformis mosseae]
MKDLQEKEFDEKGINNVNYTASSRNFADDFLNPNTLKNQLMILKILSKYPSSTSKKFYLHINLFWHETGIWYKQTHYGSNKVENFMKDIGKSVKVELLFGLLINHSDHKTVTQILQDTNVPEDAIMGVTGYKSIQGIHAYKK